MDQASARIRSAAGRSAVPMDVDAVLGHLATELREDTRTAPVTCSGHRGAEEPAFESRRCDQHVGAARLYLSLFATLPVIVWTAYSSYRRMLRNLLRLVQDVAENVDETLLGLFDVPLFQAFVQASRTHSGRPSSTKSKPTTLISAPRC